MPQLTLATVQPPRDAGQLSEVHCPMAAEAVHPVEVQPYIACLDCSLVTANQGAGTDSLLNQQLSVELDCSDSSWQLLGHLMGQDAAGPALLLGSPVGVQGLYMC